MKKLIISIVLLFALLMYITACSGSKDPEPTPGGSDTPTPPISQTIYERLDGLADKEYKKVKVGVVTNTDDIQLSAEYVLTQYNVLYSIEQLNLLPHDGDISEIPPEYKTTISGSAIVDNGEIIILDGTNVTLPSYDELKGNFNFDESNLKNIVTESNSLKADVISPSMFYSSNVNVQNMRIDVEYSETELLKIVITYRTNYSTVTNTYEFIS